MAVSMRERLEFLYPGKGADVDLRLESILDNFKARRPPPAKKSPRFSEDDAVLICYADHVREDATPTLQTMKRFLDRYVAGSLPIVHFLPFYPYSSDDGFSVIDYYRVKDEFGDWNDIENIAHDFDLMFDLVLNHISARSQWFQRFLNGDPTYSSYFIAFEQPVDTSTVFRPRTHPLLTEFQTAAGPRYVWTTFSADQIDLNYSNPDVLLELVRIVLAYIEHGAKILRLDAIAYLWKELGTSSLHLPQTHEVVKLLRQILEDVAPDVWIITETNVPHEENISYFGNGHDEAHLVYNFALPPLLLYTLMTGDASELTQWARGLSTPSKDTAFFNFTASHDGVGVTALRAMIAQSEFERLIDFIAKQGGKIGYRAVPGQKPVPYELNVVYLNATGGPEQFLVSQAIALALQGVPAVYFNSLIGAENWEEGVEKLGYNRAINRQKFDYQQLSSELEDPSSTKYRIYRAYERLLHTRRSEPLFSPLADQRILDLDPRVFAVLRSAATGRLLALANVSDQSVSLDASRLRDEMATRHVEEIISGERKAPDASVSLQPYEIAWLKASSR